MFNLHLLDHFDLQIINHFKETKHLSLVADKMFMTQPAISHRLKQMEQKLGFKFLKKQGNRFYLNAEGLVLHRYYLKSKLLIRESNDELNKLNNQISGEITIGSSDTIALYILPKIIKTFRDNYPGIKINLTSNPSKIVTEDLLNNKIDLGIALTNSLNENVNIYPLFDRKDVAITSYTNILNDSETITLKELSKLDLISLDKSSQSRFFITEWFNKYNIPISIGMELASIEMVKKYVELDYGFSIVPEFSIKHELKEKRIRKYQIVDSIEFGKIAAFTNKRIYQSTASEIFISMLNNFDY